MSLSSGRHITLGVPANTAGTIVSRTLNGFQGNVSTTSTGITTFHASTSTVVGSNLMMNSFGMTGGVVFNSTATVTASNATITSAGSAGVALGAFTVANNLSASSGGALTSNGAINASNVTFNTLGMNQPLTVNQSITVTPFGFNTMPTIALNSSGNILVNGVLSGNRVNLTSSGNAAAAITLAQPINGTGANNQVTFNSFSGAAIVNNVGAASTITANVLNINSGGAVGVALAPMHTQVDTLNLSGFGAGNNVFITEQNGLTIGSFGSANVGGSVNIGVTAGNLTFQSINAGNNISLVASAGNVTQLAGGFVANQTGGMTVTAGGGAAAMMLNGSLFAGGAGNVSITSGGSIGAIGSVTVNNGSLTIGANGGSLTQNNFTTLSTNTGTISINGQTNVLLNGSVRTNISGAINVVSIAGSITTNGLSTGATGVNDINVTLNAPSTSITALPNSFNSAGMNGSINLIANVASGDINLSDATFSTSGTGTIDVAAGRNLVLGRLSSGAGMNLSSGQTTDGSITSGGSFSSVSASNGTVNLFQFGATGQVNLCGDVATVTSGGININAQGSGGVTVRNVRSGFTGTNTVNITANNGPITQQPFTSITAGGTGGVNIAAGQSLSLQSITSGNTLNLSAGGNLSLANFAMLRGSNINSTATGGSTFNGSLTATSGTINVTASTIVINQAISAMNGGVNIAALTGGVTTGASGTLSASGGTLNVSANNGATGFVALGAGAMVSGGNTFVINIASGRNLTTSALTNTSPSGFINLTANVGTLQINGSILGAGNVNIRHNGVAAGDRIIISPFASIQALAPSAPQGNVTIAITNGAVTDIAGAPPVGGTVSQITSGGGQIFFGPGQFTNTGFTTLNAKGANITFFRDPAAADGVNAIQTNSNFIFADPPTVPSVPGFGHVVPASGGSPSSPMQMTPASFDRSGQQLVPLAAPNTTGGAQSSTTGLDKVPQAVNLPLQGFVSKKLSHSSGLSTHIRSNPGALVLGNGIDRFELKTGETVVSAIRRAFVNSGDYNVDIAPGAIAHISREADVLKVRSLVDVAGRSIHIIVGDRHIRVAPGEEVAVSDVEQHLDDAVKQDKIGRREAQKFVVNSTHYVLKSELSIVSLIQKSELLSAMYTKGSIADRNIMERVMKMAAALFQVTGKRGAYAVYEPSKVLPKSVSYSQKDSQFSGSKVSLAETRSI